MSAISAFEIATKARLGKLDAEELPLSLASRVGQIGATTLPVSLEHAVLPGPCPGHTAIAFDRLLVARATLDSLTLVTVDPAIVPSPAPRILSW